jgi:hypothetical protein
MQDDIAVLGKPAFRRSYQNLMSISAVNAMRASDNPPQST